MNASARAMKLYGFPPTRSIRVLWTLRELDVEFELVDVDPSKGEHRRPEFLAEKYPEKGLLPSALRARAGVVREPASVTTRRP